MNPYPRPELPAHKIASPAAGYAETLSCPECGHAFQLTTEGQQWRITGPADVADRLMARYGRTEQEHLIVLSLSQANVVKAETVVVVGSVSSAVVRISEIFCEPIRQRAAAIIVCHSHPGGSVDFSPDDLALTSEILAASKLLDLPCLDHVLVSASTWTSMRDRGIAFSR